MGAGKDHSGYGPTVAPVRFSDDSVDCHVISFGKLPVCIGSRAAELEVSIVDGVVEVQGGRVRGVR